MTLPLFTALFMADPVIKDFRTNVDPLIFSKPVSRGQYLLGKFFGNFFVLACCQSAFVLTWFLLQMVHKEGVVVVPGIRVVPYIKHFVVLVAISVRADPSFSAAYAGNTARSMLLFLVGIPMFYTGEAIHRDSDVRVKGLLWSHPIRTM